MKNNRNNGKGRKRAPKPSGAGKTPPKTQRVTKTESTAGKNPPEILISITVKRHKDAAGNHPHVILKNIEDNHVSVGLTTKPTKGKGSKNYALDVDPLGGGKKSFMRRQGTVAPKKDYTDPKKGVMTSKDHARAKEYGAKAEKKYRDGKNKKSND